MKKIWKRTAAILLALMMICTAGFGTLAATQSVQKLSAGLEAVSEPEETIGDEAAETAEDAEAAAPEEADLGDPELPFWAEDSLTTKSIKNYVEAVTDENSDKFIPVEDRIVTFDFDGTLYGELYPTYFDTTMFVHRVLHDDSFDAPEDLKKIAREMEEGMMTRHLPDGSEEILATSVPQAYKGMTVSEYEDYIRSFMEFPADGFENMKYGDGFYLPMISLVKYLADHDFEIWVCSGTDRICARTLVDHGLGWWVPHSRVIGTNHALAAAEQDGADPLKYVYKNDDDVVLAGELIVKNLKMNKVTSIVQEIGKVPVLAFGNTTGDLSMAQYTVNNDQYEGRAYLLLCDDTERDYGNPAKALSLQEICVNSGFHTVSMKHDFTTIYGDDVYMVDHTGNYTWMRKTPDGNDEAEEAREESPEWIGALKEAEEAEQLFVVAGVGETTAWVSMHEKDENGVWKQVMTTPGYIGKHGLGKEKEGDGKTPVGTFAFNYAFGIADDPGCALEYQKVTEDDYWSGDQREGYGYNQMVSIKDLPDLAVDDSEHIIDYIREYQYCLNVSYNEDGTPGLGSAIFLHCLGAFKPYTGGCIAIPKDQMLTVMQNVRDDCVVVIDSLKELSPETWEKLGL